MEKKRESVREELERLEGNVQVKTENSGEHEEEEEEEDEEAGTENGPTEHSEELQEINNGSPADNKENRLRFSSKYEILLLLYY